MLYHAFRSLFIGLSLILLAACAQPARVSEMAVGNIVAAHAQNTDLIGGISVGNVSGGQQTNPLWTSQVENPGFREALERSLDANGLLSPDSGSSRYVVNATLLELKQPLFGASLTVTPRVGYQVIERGGGAELVNEEITTPYTAQFSDALIAVERLRLANEGAIRESIKALLNRLGEIAIAKRGTPSGPPVVRPSATGKPVS